MGGIWKDGMEDKEEKPTVGLCLQHTDEIQQREPWPGSQEAWEEAEPSCYKSALCSQQIHLPSLGCSSSDHECSLEMSLDPRQPIQL